MDSAPFVLPPYGLYGGWRVRGTKSYQPMMASVITTTLTTQLKNKEPDRNVNVTYYDRWFVIQAVDDDKPLSKISLFIIDRALKCAVETVQSVRCLRTRYTHTHHFQRIAKLHHRSVLRWHLHHPCHVFGPTGLGSWPVVIWNESRAGQVTFVDLAANCQSFQT